MGPGFSSQFLQELVEGLIEFIHAFILKLFGERAEINSQIRQPVDNVGGFVQIFLKP